MNSGLWTMVAVAGLALIGCSSSHHHSPAASTPPGNTAPTDFAAFVNQQLPMQPAFGSTPAATGSLTNDLGLGDASVFSSASFGSGDALPAGTNQAAVACTQAGKAACDPATSADLNSTLN